MKGVPCLLFLFGLSFHGNLGDKKSFVLLQGSNVADMVFVAEFNDRAHRVILTVLLQEGGGGGGQGTGRSKGRSIRGCQRSE